MRRVYAPGCALWIYKREVVERVVEFLNKEVGEVSTISACCESNPDLAGEVEVINTCSSCEKKYRTLGADIRSTSFWDILVKSKNFNFPDYGGIEVSMHDPCPARKEDKTHKWVRELLGKMNIKVVEAENNRNKSVCCGDSFYGKVPTEITKGLMKKRAEQMPCDEVVVYCVSCIKSMHIGGKKPLYLLDLLFNEKTTIGSYEPEVWHGELDDFIKSNS